MCLLFVERKHDRRNFQRIPNLRNRSRYFYYMCKGLLVRLAGKACWALLTLFIVRKEALPGKIIL